MEQLNYQNIVAFAQKAISGWGVDALVLEATLWPLCRRTDQGSYLSYEVTVDEPDGYGEREITTYEGLVPCDD